MAVLHLGVLDVPYGGSTKKVAVETTGDVATFLEDKYHVYEHFFQLHGQEISDSLAVALKDSLEDLLSGAPASSSPLAGAESDMQTMFVRFIDSKEMDRLGFPGIPTKAALDGVNHRMQNPNAKRGPRPSFKDTGLYEQSFRAWVDE